MTTATMHPAAAKAAAEREYKFSEARHLMSFGVHPDQIAAQLGTNSMAVERLALRWGQRDIATYFQGHGKTCACGAPINRSSRECRDCAFERRYGWAA